MSNPITDRQTLNDFLDADHALKSAEQLMSEVEKLIKIANINTGLAENALSEFEGLNGCITMDRDEIRDIISEYTQGE